MNNKGSIGLYVISIVNLLIMHYTILLTCRVEEAIDALLWIDNLGGIVVDITIILAISLIITRGKLRQSLLVSAIITILWSFSNIIYSRFFHHYITLSAIGQAGTLADSFMLQNIMQGFNWYDIAYVGLAILLCWFYYLSKNEKSSFKKKHLLLSWPISLFIIDLIAHFAFCVSNPDLRSLSYYMHRLHVRHFELLHSSAEPNWSSFHRGSFRQLFIP